MNKKSSLSLCILILSLCFCKDKDTGNKKLKYLASMSSDTSDDINAQTDEPNYLFGDAKSLNQFEWDSDTSLFFAKVPSKPIYSDSIVFHLFYFQDGEGGTLTGYWGKSRENNTLYFIPFYIRNCPIAYPILSVFEDESLFKGKDSGNCSNSNKYFRLGLYEAESKLSKDSMYEVNLTVLPLQGVNITHEEHIKHASQAFIKISYSKGIVDFKYEPDMEYTILPWAFEYVFLKYNGFDIDFPQASARLQRVHSTKLDNSR